MTRIPEFVELLEVSCRDSLLWQTPQFDSRIQAFNVTLSGVNLSDQAQLHSAAWLCASDRVSGGLLQERLSVQPGQSCSEDVELFSPERARASLVEG